MERVRESRPESLRGGVTGRRGLWVLRPHEVGGLPMGEFIQPLGHHAQRNAVAMRVLRVASLATLQPSPSFVGRRDKRQIQRLAQFGQRVY